MSNLPPIVLVGLGGNTVELLELIETQYRIAAILSDTPAHAPAYCGTPVHRLDQASRFADCAFLFLIGSEQSFPRRRAMIDALGVPDQRFATLVDPRAVVSRLATLGAGTVLSSGVTITANAVLENHVLVLPQTVIHHDVRIGDCSIIGSHVTIAGGVQIGARCYIGSASAIRNGVSIGDGALIGLGANVVKDVPPGAVMVGNPARALPARDAKA